MSGKQRRNRGAPFVHDGCAHNFSLARGEINYKQPVLLERVLDARSLSSAMLPGRLTNVRRRQRTRKCGEMLFFHACTMSKSLSSHSANAQKGVGEPWFLVISSSSTSQKHNISTLSGHIEFASGELSFFPFKRYHAKQRDATRKLGKAEVRGRTERTADLENPLTNERC